MLKTDSKLFEKMLKKMEYEKCPINEIRCKLKYISKTCDYENCKVKKFLKENNIIISWNKPFENQLMNQTAREFSIYEKPLLVRRICLLLLSFPSSLNTKTKIASWFLPQLKSSKRDIDKEKDIGWK